MSSLLQNIPPPSPPQQQAVSRAGGASPFRPSLANRFQAAQLDHVTSRTSSPASINREKSPFTQTSQFNPASSMNGQRLGPPQMTAAQYQQSLNNAAILALQQQASRQAPEQPKTVSPKDVQLEYHEDDQTPLFPSSQDQSSHFSLPRDESSSNFSTSSAFAQPNQYYTSVPPSSQNSQQSYPFLSHQGRQSSLHSANDQSLPDFPAHLAFMETTASSDSGQEQSTPVPAPTSAPPARPRDTSSDAGTYTCTFHGCAQGFDGPTKLQRHKREAHGQSSPASTKSVSTSGTSAPSTSIANQGHTSSAATIALRNSQAGPHKCDRINPTTGNPCSSVFSRTYDLTRHEDTIHSIRKQKDRCHLCTEERTFSRKDSLTRHMRMVHPDVNWPGKQRRRGGKDGL